MKRGGLELSLLLLSLAFLFIFSIHFSSASSPNIINQASFETGWDGFTNWGGGTPGCARATDTAYAGSYSVEDHNTGCLFYNSWSNQDNVWVLLWFRMTNVPTDQWKWARFTRGSVTNFGGFFTDGQTLAWGWDDENSAIVNEIGLTKAQVADGKWHSLEVEYSRNGDPSGWPNARFWFDGKPQYAEFNGRTTLTYPGQDSSYWQNGTLYAGTRSNSAQIDGISFLSTLNGGGNNGQTNIDCVSVSSAGYIDSNTYNCGGSSPQPPANDTTPPTATITAPTNNRAFSAGTTSTTLSATTNEAATCKYSISDQAYGGMTSTFTTTGATSHSTTISGLSNGNNYTYYIRCQDTSGNAMVTSQSVRFSVQNTAPPSSICGDGICNATETSTTCPADCQIQIPPSSSNTLFTENFEDTNFASRGWYDSPGFALTTTEHMPGSTGSYQAHFAKGASTPAGGSGGRHTMNATNSVYLSYWIKYSSNWVGSGLNYDPHEFYFFTSDDDAYVSPGNNHLTVYTEDNYASGGLKTVLQTQDGLNIDQSKINQNLIGVTENRAVSGCNGNPPDGAQLYNCYVNGAAYDNQKIWTSSVNVITDANKNSWHHIEAYYQLNTISNGIGQNNGIAQEWVDGNLAINHTNVLFRTGAHPNMMFNQMFLGPYMGSGSPVDQYMWIDNITVATAIPGNATQLPDTFPPVTTIISPANQQVLPAGTRSIQLSAITSEAATCKYSTTNQIYDSMPNTFTTTGAISHNTTITGLQDGQNYNYYVRCSDLLGNKNNASSIASFSVAQTAAFCGDGICNGNETSTTCLQDCPLPACQLTSASWSTANASEGDIVYLNVFGTNCNGKNISFNVLESDLLGSYNVNVTPKNSAFNGASASGTWKAEWQNVGLIGQLLGLIGLAPDPTYFFTATVAGTNQTIQSSDPLLKVTRVPFCGDSIINNAEQCDNGSLNGIACTPSYGSSCNYCSSTCTIQTVQGPFCGDNVCNNGETSTSCIHDCPIIPSCGDGICNGNETSTTCSRDCPLPVDTTVPIATITSPTNNQVLPAGTKETILFVRTNEDAMCRYDSADGAYSSMMYSLDGTNTSHSAFITNLQDGTNYTRYSRCIDNAGNAMNSSAQVSFSVAQPALFCGDNICNNGETSATCPNDCHTSFCGDNVCNASETSATCPADCPLACTLTSASWGITNTTEGTTVRLDVTGNNCNMKIISFDVKEYDSLGLDDPVNVNPLDVIFSGNSVSGTWKAEWQPEGAGESDPPEYHFIAKVQDPFGLGDSIDSGTSNSQLLTVYRLNNNTCGDSIINNAEQCDNGSLNGIACTPSYGSSCNYCSSTCQEATVNGSYCGDGICNGNETNNTCTADCPITSDHIAPATPGQPQITFSSSAASGANYDATWPQSIDQPSGLPVHKYTWTAGHNNGYGMTSGISTTNFTSFTIAYKANGAKDTGFFCVKAVDDSGNPSKQQSCNAVSIPAYNSNNTNGTNGTGTDRDRTPPVISNLQPTGTLPSGTRSVTLSVATDENATCKYSTSRGTSYSSMRSSFSTTDGINHSANVTGLRNWFGFFGRTYNYYVRCKDALGNVNTRDAVISFRISR